MTLLEFAVLLGGVLQVLDVISTKLVLGEGGVERNPVVQWLMDRLGGGWVIAKAAGGFGSIYLLWQIEAAGLLLALNGLLLLVVANNFRVWRNM